MLAHFPLFEQSTQYGYSFEDCVEAQMPKINVVRAKQRDCKDIGLYVGNLFAAYPQGMQFKQFVQVCQE